MISKVKGKARKMLAAPEGKWMMYVLQFSFIALLFLVFLRWNAESDMHLLSQAGAVTDV